MWLERGQKEKPTSAQKPYDNLISMSGQNCSHSRANAYRSPPIMRGRMRCSAGE